MKHQLYWTLTAISLSGCSVAKTPSDLSASESDRTVSTGAGFGELDRVAKPSRRTATAVTSVSSRNGHGSGRTEAGRRPRPG